MSSLILMYLGLSEDVQKVYKVNLKYPDTATDQFGNEGFWTIISYQVRNLCFFRKKKFNTVLWQT